MLVLAPLSRYLKVSAILGPPTSLFLVQGVADANGNPRTDQKREP